MKQVTNVVVNVLNVNAFGQVQEGELMRNSLLTITVLVAVSTESVLSNTAQAEANTHNKRITHHLSLRGGRDRYIARSSSDSTSFSSSSAFHAGPPKYR
jgi:hypothetical protein